MTSPVRNLVAAGAVAAGMAGLAILTTSGGEYGWKVALAAVGLVLWVVGGLWKEA